MAEINKIDDFLAFDGKNYMMSSDMKSEIINNVYEINNKAVKDVFSDPVIDSENISLDLKYAIYRKINGLYLKHFDYDRFTSGYEKEQLNKLYMDVELSDVYKKYGDKDGAIKILTSNAEQLNEHYESLYQKEEVHR